MEFLPQIYRFNAIPIKNLNFFFMKASKILLYIYLAVPGGIWDLSSLTTAQTHTPCIGSAILTTRPPGKSLQLTKRNKVSKIIKRHLLLLVKVE